MENSVSPGLGKGSRNLVTVTPLTELLPAPGPSTLPYYGADDNGDDGNDGGDGNDYMLITWHDPPFPPCEQSEQPSVQLTWEM